MTLGIEDEETVKDLAEFEQRITEAVGALENVLGAADKIWPIGREWPGSKHVRELIVRLRESGTRMAETRRDIRTDLATKQRGLGTGVVVGLFGRRACVQKDE